MGLIIGMDEAGYGPNLGPLVITATAWEVPGHPSKIDLWTEFAGIVATSPPENGSHIQIADSKQVYSPARGLKNLEAGVLCALGVGGQSPGTFRELWKLLAVSADDAGDAEPWFAAADVPLPHVASREPDLPLLRAWSTCCTARGIRLRAIRSEIVLTRRFNRLTEKYSSKGQALTQISMEVLRKVWPDDDEPTLVYADKHGGRNRYHDFLPIAVGDRFIECREEGMDCSRYLAGNAEIRFETRAERHFPVALASMVSKYVRELSMVLFNRFWIERLPALRPTAGYPTDALRFRAEIAPLQRELGIADDVLWRNR